MLKLTRVRDVLRWDNFTSLEYWMLVKCICMGDGVFMSVPGHLCNRKSSLLSLLTTIRVVLILLLLISLENTYNFNELNIQTKALKSNIIQIPTCTCRHMTLKVCNHMIAAMELEGPQTYLLQHDRSIIDPTPI